MKYSVSRSLELQKLHQLCLILSLFHGTQQLQQQSCDSTWIVSQGTETNLSASVIFLHYRFRSKLKIMQNEVGTSH